MTPVKKKSATAAHAPLRANRLPVIVSFLPPATKKPTPSRPSPLPGTSRLLLSWK